MNTTILDHRVSILRTAARNVSDFIDEFGTIDGETYDQLDRAASQLFGDWSPEQELADAILAELVRARAKWPGKNVTFAALVEEVGELATATFEESRARVREEAIQVAVMAMRMVLDGDHTFNDWRQGRGLDALTDQIEEATE